MKDIIFYDSGIGGIALLNNTRKLCKKENFLYFADNINMPYGEKSQKEVLDLVISNLDPIVKTTTKCVVIACNTITSRSISEVRKAFPKTKIFGIEPEIKSAMKPNIKNTLLIATPQTCEAIKQKLNQTSEAHNITVQKASALAKIIENHIWDKEEIYREIKKIKRCHQTKFDSLILGCTHYALVKDVFYYAFSENIKIFDGIKGTATNISKSIEKEKRGFGSLKLHLTNDDIKEKLKYVSLIN